MSDYWREGAGAASAEQRAQFAPGIAKAQRYLDGLANKGEIPRQFTLDRPRLGPLIEWKVIPRTYIDNRQPKEALLQGIAVGGRSSTSYARDLVARSTDEIPNEPTEFGVVYPTAWNLVPGVRYPTTHQVFEAAKEQGLIELSVRQSLIVIGEMADQPRGDWFVAGHKPVIDSFGHTGMLVAGHGALGRWFSGCWARPDSEWHAGSQFIMAREHLSQPDKPQLHQSLEALIGKGVEMHTPRVGITDKDGLLAGLGNRRVTTYARKLVNMPEVKISTEPRDATVVIVTGNILVPDNDGYITTEQARQAAENLGLSPIQVDEFLATPPTVDQPRGDWIVGMHEPIMGLVDDPELLIAERSGGGLWLWSYLGRPGSWWLSDCRFAFSLRK